MAGFEVTLYGRIWVTPKVSTIHDRMPAILMPPEYDEWLDRGETERPPTHLLRPYPETTLQIHPANPKVGNVHNQSIDLLDLP